MNDTPPPIDSRSAFTAAIHWAIEHATARRARSITCVDPNFADWPLNDPALHARLTDWLRLPKRRLVLVAGSFDEMPRCHPRFVAWRVDWAHAVDAFAPPEDMRADMPTLLLDDADLSLQLIDPVHWRGRAELDARTAQLWREKLDALLQRSEPAFPVNRLGL